MNHQFLEDLWHSRFRSWHEADQVTEVKVRCEQGAEVHNSHDYMTNIEVP